MFSMLGGTRRGCGAGQSLACVSQSHGILDAFHWRRSILKEAVERDYLDISETIQYLHIANYDNLDIPST